MAVHAPPPRPLLAHLVPITLSYTPLLFAHVQLLPCPHILASSISSPAYLILTASPALALCFTFYILFHRCTQVEVRLDDSICVETLFSQSTRTSNNLLFLKPLQMTRFGPADVEGTHADPASIAWLWAKDFSTLAALRGHEIAGPTANV